jgi:hypothetical protein
MRFLKSLKKWELKDIADTALNQDAIDIQVKRIKLIYDSLLKEGFSEEQAVRIVSGPISTETKGFLI